ncbi:response regulator transcription factor [Vallitalea okinawensis]|uniref:response regulator transcription factor n=1 Tax=Vallitalea okinawensis TaxID=2078660 RepID=UPI000CFB58D1|nr:helix-turn-helix domain-containing protein [Vallitalea okinawensis]
MYKVMVVDDEIWTVKGIIASCQWGELGCKVVFDTTSPMEALNYMANHEVDIVLVDINMDEMNGLDLIKEARMKGVKSEFVIISGYGEFEYARSALQYGVFDYILKPVDRTILNDTIQNLVKSIQLKEDTHGESLWLTIEKILNKDIRNFSDAFSERGLEPKYSGFQVVIIEGELSQQYMNKHFKSEQVLYITLPLGQQKFLVFMNSDNDLSKQLCEDTFNLKVGVSSYTREKEGIVRLYYEADCSFYNNFIAGPKAYVFEKNVSKGEAIIQNLITGNAARYYEIIETLALNKENYTIEEFTLLYNSTAAWCNYYYVDHVLHNYTSYDEIYKNFKDVRELIEFLKDMVQGIKEVQGIKDGIDKDENIQEILDYIHEHYHENIYLSDLANEFFYNQSYISSLFKKHLDKTFTEYLKDFRMTKACGLLLETEHSITDIANQVGYSDYCYFSKIFKKSYGITPLQYRKGR